MNKSFTIKSCPVSISLELYPLVLRAAFGYALSHHPSTMDFFIICSLCPSSSLFTLVYSTAHSLTTERKDALFTLHINDVVGYGEVGLPPKKPFCYKADYNDMLQYCIYYAEKVCSPSLHFFVHQPRLSLLSRPSFHIPSLLTSFLFLSFPALISVSISLSHNINIQAEEVVSSVKDFPTYDPFHELPSKFFAPLRPTASGILLHLPNQQINKQIKLIKTNKTEKIAPLPHFHQQLMYK